MLVGILAGCVTSSVIAAVFIAPTFSICISVFAGFFTNPDSLPDFSFWIKYLCPPFFIRNGLLKNEFDDLDYDDDIVPSPQDRFGYEGEIVENFMIVLVHFCVIFIITTYVFKIKIKTIS